MKKMVMMMLVVGLCFGCGLAAFGEGRVLFDFEKGLGGWEIPDWAYEQDDYVAEKIETSNDAASKGKNSLKLTANFPGKRWTAAVAEVMEYYDFTPYSTISCDVMVPKTAPEGLRAKIILTIGDNWTWTEMSKSVKLEPGVWTTLSANMKPESMDWKKTNPTDSFRADVRKIDIRVESNKKPEYAGPIYIDNVRVE